MRLFHCFYFDYLCYSVLINGLSIIIGCFRTILFIYIYFFSLKDNFDKLIK